MPFNLLLVRTMMLKNATYLYENGFTNNMSTAKEIISYVVDQATYNRVKDLYHVSPMHH
jgi:hypothetical protein